jgi:hypothetical protein
VSAFTASLQPDLVPLGITAGITPSAQGALSGEDKPKHINAAEDDMSPTSRVPTDTHPSSPRCAHSTITQTDHDWHHR